MPSVVDEYVAKDDPVRVYDAFVDALDFKELGIIINPKKSGASEYCPKTMLKVLVYGYSYRIRSSRQLERACYHNLSFIWLAGDLKPDYRTIARFRSDNKEAIKKVLKQCVKLCVDLDLISGNAIFIDGSSFRANASIKNTWTQERCQRHLISINERIDKIIDESETIDKSEEDQESLIKIKEELTDKMVLRERIKKTLSELKEAERSSLNTVDADCVKVKGRQGTHAGYNVQNTVDQKHGLIINSEVTTKSQDAGQLNEQIKSACAVLEKEPKVVIADCGYYQLEDLSKISENIKIIIPSHKQIKKERKRKLPIFDKSKFRYDIKKDEYICPQNKRLKFNCNTANGDRYYKCSGKYCRDCINFGICTKSNQGRGLRQNKHSALCDKLETTYDSPVGKAMYRLRNQKVELPFGHFKYNLGAGQFLLRGKNKTNAEVSLLSTSFNIARMITLIGIRELITKLIPA
jgi:transposase